MAKRKLLQRISQPDTLDGTEFNVAEISFRIRNRAVTKFAHPERFGHYDSWLDCLGETSFEVWDAAHERREARLWDKRRDETADAKFFADEDAITEHLQAALATLPQHQRTLEVQLILAMDARDAVLRPSELKQAA